MRRPLLVTTIALALPFMLGVAVSAQQAEEAGSAGAFEPAGLLADARSSHTATLLPDGRILIVGGGGPDDLVAMAEIWDPSRGSFSAAGTLVEPRLEPSSTLLLDGRVLVSDCCSPSEVWDPAIGAFGESGSLASTDADPLLRLNVGRVNHTITRLPDDRLLIVGGVGSQSSTAEIWDPATESIETIELVESRQGHTATTLSDGRVLVVGGVDGEFFSPRSSAEIWDPEGGLLSEAGALTRARTEHSASLLDDGRVLVVGGWVDGGLVSEAELWDPATEEFSAAGSLIETRTLHTATVLDDGRVLIVGGRGPARGVLATAEIWSPGES